MTWPLKLRVLYLSSMANRFPSWITKRSTYSAVAPVRRNGTSRRMEASGNVVCSCQASACWKSASEWKTGRLLASNSSALLRSFVSIRFHSPFEATTHHPLLPPPQPEPSGGDRKCMSRWANAPNWLTEGQAKFGSCAYAVRMFSAPCSRSSLRTMKCPRAMS